MKAEGGRERGAVVFEYRYKKFFRKYRSDYSL
jgi:hypothetical protein